MEALFSTINTTTPGASDSGVAGNGQATGKDMFLSLLVAQIRNQNPLEPKDPSEFVNQLTQLSQTEAMQKLVSQNSANAAMLESLQMLSMGAQVGSQLSVHTANVQLDTVPVQGSFTLASGSAQTALVLTGADGVKHRIELGTRGAGPVPFTIDPVAQGLPAGTYALGVDAGEQAAPDVEVVGELSSVRLAAGGAVLHVTHVGDVPASAVKSFNGRATASTI